MTLHLPDFKERLKKASHYTDGYKDEFYNIIEDKIIAGLLSYIKRNEFVTEFTPATILECALFFGYFLNACLSETSDVIEIRLRIGNTQYYDEIALDLFKYLEVK